MGFREFFCASNGYVCPVLGQILSVGLLTVPTHGRAQAQDLRISLSQQYFPTAGQTEQRQDYTDIGVNLDLHHDGKTWSSGMNGIYFGAIQSGEEQYFGLPELYVGRSVDSESRLHVTLGRQKRQWSQFDEEFGVGLWQPELRWDYLYPVQEGLTGLFVDYQATPSLTFTFFLSEIYLPDQGPNFQLQNGQFQSVNRWFWSPRVDLQVGRGETELSYALDRLSVSDVLFQPSVGGMVRYQVPQTPLWAQLSWAYQPINQMHLAFDCPQCATPAELTVQATIHPMILKHQLATAEIGFADDEQSGWLSVTLDRPDSPGGPPQWIQSSYNQVIYAGASYRHALAFLHQRAWVKGSFLKAFESSAGNGFSLLEGTAQTSLDRIPYQELAAVELDWPMIGAWAGMTWDLRYSYSIPEQGGWLSSGLVLQRKHWSWNVGVDVIGANVDPDDANAGLFSRYRANDRAMAGMSYVF